MYRSINETIKLLKQLDSNTPLSTYFLRELSKTNEIITLKIKSKVLINIPSLFRYLHLEINEIKGEI